MATTKPLWNPVVLVSMMQHGVTEGRLERLNESIHVDRRMVAALVAMVAERIHSDSVLAQCPRPFGLCRLNYLLGLSERTRGSAGERCHLVSPFPIDRFGQFATTARFGAAPASRPGWWARSRPPTNS
jgi:hypothetical protein